MLDHDIYTLTCTRAEAFAAAITAAIVNGASGRAETWKMLRVTSLEVDKTDPRGYKIVVEGLRAVSFPFKPTEKVLIGECVAGGNIWENATDGSIELRTVGNCVRFLLEITSSS
jgi:hypothetical protein